MDEGSRGEIIQRAMEAAAVVEGFNGIEDGVVVAVAGGTHALKKGVSGQELTP